MTVNGSVLHLLWGPSQIVLTYRETPRSNPCCYHFVYAWNLEWSTLQEVLPLPMFQPLTRMPCLTEALSMAYHLCRTIHSASQLKPEERSTSLLVGHSTTAGAVKIVTATKSVVMRDHAVMMEGAVTRGSAAATKDPVRKVVARIENIVEMRSLADRKAQRHCSQEQ